MLALINHTRQATYILNRKKQLSHFRFNNIDLHLSAFTFHLSASLNY